MTGTTVKRSIVSLWVATLVALAGSAALAASGNDPCAAVLGSMRAQADGKPYRVTTVGMDASTGKVTNRSSTRVIPPDRMHIVDGDNETIIIRGKGTFSRTKGGAWKRSEVDLTAALDPMDAKKRAQTEKIFRDTTKSCKQVGSETLNGKPVDLWEYTSAGFGVTSTTRSWLGRVDRLPYKVEIKGRVLSMKTKTTQTIEYDPAIRIEAPL